MTSAEPIRVLIIDDEPSYALALEMALGMDGFDAKSANSAEEGTEIIQNRQFDVVVLDYSMPGMSGLEFMAWMRERGIGVPVLMVTAAGSEAVAVEAIKAGAKNYFRKDQIDTQQLASEIMAIHERTVVLRAKKDIEEEQHKFTEKKKELASLHSFQETVGSIGQFVENGLADVSKKLQHEGEHLLSLVAENKKARLAKFLEDLKREIDMVAAGVKSMTDLSGLVSQKLEDIGEEKKTGEE